MSMKAALRRFYEKHKRKFLIALIIFLLAIFTVVPEMTSALVPASGGYDPDAVAGTFEMDGTVKVTHGEYQAARKDYQMTAGAFGNRETPLEVWRYIILREGARREGVEVPSSDLRDMIKRFVGSGTAAQYKNLIKQRYGVEPARFEQAWRDYMSVDCLRGVYRMSYNVGLPASRKDMMALVLQSTRGHAKVDYAALDATEFLEQAGEAYRAKPKEEQLKELEEFFDRDVTVRMAGRRFENPVRYDVEFLYTIHKNLNEESYKKIEALFARAYPDYDLGRLEESEAELRSFFKQYRGRLLERVGTSWKDVKRKATKTFEATKDGTKKEEAGKEGDGNDEEGAKDGDTGEKKENGEGTEGEGDKEENGDKEKEEEKAPEITEELRKAWQNHGFSLVQDIVDRELKVRRMYRVWRAEIDESKDVKGLFEKLKKADDPEDPICATEAGKGLIVYRTFDGPITGDEIEDLEDSGVRFTHNVRNRVNTTRSKNSELPALHRHADTMGAEGHGRMILRLNKVDPRRRKTFKELTEGERTDLVKQFLIPARARDLAKAKLEELRKECTNKDAPLDADAFVAKAEELGCRVRRDEWFAPTETPEEPSEERFWKDALERMRDRHFLLRELSPQLTADEKQEKVKPGMYMEVMVNKPFDVSAGPLGGAYLVYVKERRNPDATMVPESLFQRVMIEALQKRRDLDRKRWSENYDGLIEDFGITFFGSMKEEIEEDRAKRARAGSQP